MKLLGDGTKYAIRDQTVTVPAAAYGDDLAIRIVVERGPIIFSVGSSDGAGDYIPMTTLDTGVHSLAFLSSYAGGDAHIRVKSCLAYSCYIDSIVFEPSGPMEIAAPWYEEDLGLIRYAQSGDIIFISCEGYLQRKIERRATKSWSVVWYLSEDGPYFNINTTAITITPSGLTGDVTLTASAALFLSGHVGALFSVKSAGQSVTSSISSQNVFTTSIRVEGSGEARRFNVVITGTWVATVTVQRSIGVEGNWVDVLQYTSNVATTYADGLSEQIVYYRIGIKTGGYTSGTAICNLDYPNGSKTGVARIVAYSSPTSVTAQVLKPFGSLVASELWYEGCWSSTSGFPGAVAFFEGRLWFAGQNGVWASVSDDFYNFDPSYVGDAGPINRTIGSGPVDTVNWLMPVQRLILGAEGAEFSIRASSFDEVITPSNFNIKEVSTQGSNKTGAVKVDSQGIFIQRCGARVYEMSYGLESGDYRASDLSALIPEIGEPSIIELVVQRKPDTRVHCIRSDGKVAMLLYNPLEKILCWAMMATDGVIKSGAVLPGVAEDSVYYTVTRIINSTPVCYVEKWAYDAETKGEVATVLTDASYIYSGGATSTIIGLRYLEGKTVQVWSSSKVFHTGVVSSGSLELPEAVTYAVIGLPYSATWKSSKLIFAAPSGGENENIFPFIKRIYKLGLLLTDVYDKALQFGPSFTELDDLPEVENGKTVEPDTMRTSYDEEFIEFPGSWDPDSRLCLVVSSPRPCTVLAAVIGFQVAD
jgi:hypothetical protein